MYEIVKNVLKHQTWLVYFPEKETNKVSLIVALDYYLETTTAAEPKQLDSHMKK